MFLESFDRLRIYKNESTPNTTGTILSRFGNEYERQKNSYNLAASMSRSPIITALVEYDGELFEPSVAADTCPLYQHVLVSSLLVGLTNPSDTERLNQILCGRIVEDVDTIRDDEPLSGKRGSEYAPMSQCWRLTIELARLVKFMRDTEEMPPMSGLGGNEEELRELLNKREQVKRHNDMRQLVFATWTDIRSRLTGTPKLGLETPETLPSEGESQTKEVQVYAYDARGQFKLDGPEYGEMIDWVEAGTLNPMKTMVGTNNLALYLGEDEMIYLNFANTAEHCPKKPHRDFYGSWS